MTDFLGKKLAALPLAGALQDADLLYTVQSASDRRLPASALRTYIGANTPAGATTYIQYNSAGAFSATANFKYEKNALSVGPVDQLTVTAANLYMQQHSTTYTGNSEYIHLIGEGSAVSNHAVAGLAITQTTAGALTYHGYAFSIGNSSDIGYETGVIIGDQWANSGGNIWGTHIVNHVPDASPNGDKTVTRGHVTDLDRHVLASVDDSDIGFYAHNLGSELPGSTAVIGRGACFRGNGYIYGLQLLPWNGLNFSYFLDFQSDRGTPASGITNLMRWTDLDKSAGSAVLNQALVVGERILNVPKIRFQPGDDTPLPSGIALGVGYNTDAVTNTQMGISFYAYSDGNLYNDYKTFTAGYIRFRCGSGAEAGSARTWMTVDPANGNIGLGGVPTKKLDVTGTLGVSGVATFAASKGVVMSTSSSPLSGDAGTAGAITWDSTYIYICTASGAWKRVAMTGGY